MQITNSMLETLQEVEWQGIALDRKKAQAEYDKLNKKHVSK